MYTLTHALNYCFVFVKLLPMFAMCTYPETAKNVLYKLCIDNAK